MQEIFKDIPGYEGHYQVSNIGNVKSLKYNKERFLKKTIVKGNYFSVGFNKNKKYKTIHVHQLMAITFLNHKPSKHHIVVDHIDNNGLNNNLKNLQLITHQQNIRKDKNKNASSKYMGVHYCNRSNRWISKIYHLKKAIYIGAFKNEKEARNAYDLKLKALIESK